MEIVKQQVGDVLEARIRGRLDASWADHLSADLDETVRGGCHQIRLDLSNVDYLSSAGIRVLLKFYKQLRRISGSFHISSASEAVESVLNLAGFGELLIISGLHAAGEDGQAPSRDAESATGAGFRQMGIRGTSFEVHPLSPGATLACRAIGDPTLLAGCRFEAGNSQSITFGRSMIGLGLGAPGRDFAACQGRYGEFLAVGGSAAFLPTDGTNVPDYLIATGKFVPELSVLYGLDAEGEFATLARFESGTDAKKMTLSELAASCLEISGAAAAGVAIVAESAGLVGATLRKSPGAGSGPKAPFAHPEIREWLSYSPERVHTRSVALIAGIVAREPGSSLARFVRPLGGPGSARGHFHAAVFSYRPIQKGRIDLHETVDALFESDALESVMHLLRDDREITGAGESEFVRGACWIGPIARIDETLSGGKAKA